MWCGIALCSYTFLSEQSCVLSIDYIELHGSDRKLIPFCVLFSSSPPPLIAHPLYPTAHLPHDPSPPHLLTTSTGMPMEVGGEWGTREDPSEDEELIDRGLPSCPEYPAPLAVSEKYS